MILLRLIVYLQLVQYLKHVYMFLIRYYYRKTKQMAQLLVAFFIALLCFVCVLSSIGHCPEQRKENATRGAICVLKHNSDYVGQLRFSGTIRLSESTGQPLTLEATITGRSPSARNEKIKRGLHVHRFGHISESCNLSGPDYNPTNKSHGDKDSEIRHVGDYGNIELLTNGNVSVKLVDTVSSLFGHDTILGRSIVIHANEDDLGKGLSQESQSSGTSGEIVSCCVIALEKESILDA